MAIEVEIKLKIRDRQALAGFCGRRMCISGRHIMIL